MKINKSYYYFNPNSKTLEKKELNPIQRILRNVLGWYAETHLLKVVKEGYKVSVGPKASSLGPSSFFSLIEKAEKTGRFNTMVPIDVNVNKSIWLRYKIASIGRDSNPYLYSIQFYLRDSSSTTYSCMEFTKFRDKAILWKRQDLLNNEWTDTGINFLRASLLKYTPYMQLFQKSFRQNTDSQISFCVQEPNYHRYPRAFFDSYSHRKGDPETFIKKAKGSNGAV